MKVTSKRRKYIVTINHEWVSLLAGQGEEAYRFVDEVNKRIHAFLSGNREVEVLSCMTFTGDDGKTHKSIEIKVLEGRHSGGLLKRLRKKLHK